MAQMVLHKCIVLFAILIATLLSGISPWFLLRSFRTQRTNFSQKERVQFIFSCLNMFSGGVFLGVCFMHLLPEVKDHMTYFMSELKYGRSFPATEFLVVVGFFLVVITEIIVSQYLMKKDERKNISTENQRQYNPITEEISQRDEMHYKDTRPEGATTYGSIPKKTNEKDKRDNIISIKKTRDINASYSAPPTISECGHEPSLLQDLSSDNNDQTVRSLLLFVALSLHTVFDGLSLGLQSDISKLYSLFTAVIIHKILIGFTLGLQIFEYMTWTLTKSFLLMLLFACISPIGMAIGIVIGTIKEHEMSQAIASAILNGLATGTFLYVTFIEIIGRELGKKATVIHVLFSIAGFGLMTALVFFE